MTPRHAQDGAGPPQGYTEQPYDNRPPPDALSSVDPIFGAGSDGIAQFEGAMLNGIQCEQLAQGLAMRPVSSIPHTNASAHTHPELKNMIEMSNPSQAQELGQLWNSLGNEMMHFGERLRDTTKNSEAIWGGQAGDAARAALSALATWSQHTGQGVQFMSTTVRTQADAAHTAKASMPDPPVPPYDSGKYQDQLNSTSDPAEWARIMSDSYQQANQQHAKYADAVRVVEAYSASLHETNAAMPAFTPPPTFGDGSTGHTPRVPTPGGRSGATLPPMGSAGGPVPGSAHGGPAPGGTDAGGVPGGANGSPADTNVGGPGNNDTAPAATPAQSVSYAPEIPGGGVPAGGSGGESSFLPAAAIGGTGPGERGSSASGRGVGGGFGPRGSGGPGSRNPRGGNPRIVNPPASTFDSDPDANAPKRGGAGSGLPPIPGTSPGEKDAEHRRPSYLIETEDIWGDGLRVAPPVIGEDPPQYHY